MIADLAPIDHGPHRLALTVYHHDVEGRREGVILDGLHQRVRVVSLVEPDRQHAAATIGRLFDQLEDAPVRRWVRSMASLTCSIIKQPTSVAVAGCARRGMKRKHCSGDGQH